MTGDYNGEDPSFSSQSFDSIHYGDKSSITEEGKSCVRIRHRLYRMKQHNMIMMGSDYIRMMKL